MLQDLRFALRMLRHNPGFTAVAVLSLALGIGANSAIFSVFDEVLVKLLPVRAPRELVGVTTRGPMGMGSYPVFREFRARNQVLAGLAAHSWPNKAGMSTSGTGEVELVSRDLVSGNFFSVLGVEPALGRVLTAEDERAPGASPVAVLTYSFWRRRFGGDPEIIGKTIKVNGYGFTVVGVSQRGFSGTEVGTPVDVFLPLTMVAQIDPSFLGLNSLNWHWLQAIGRLKPGMNIKQAEAALNVLAPQVADALQQWQVSQNIPRERQRRLKGAQVRLQPGAQGTSMLRQRLTEPLRILMIVVGAVLLIACANVANLLLARAAARQKEIAIRLAIGSGRGRLLRQLLSESVLLSLLGGAIGLLFAFYGARLLVHLLPAGRGPITLNLTPDWRLLGFTLAVSVATGLIFGIAPAWQATRLDLASSMKDGSGAAPGGQRFGVKKLMVVAQVSLCLMLLIGAGLFVRSLDNLWSLDPGFRRENLLIVDVNPAQLGYKGARLRSFYDQLLARARRLPGVRSASLSLVTPMTGASRNSDFSVEGYQPQPGERMELYFNPVSDGYFETLGISVLMGRDFRPEDNPAVLPEQDFVGAAVGARRDEGRPPESGRRLAIINESMARHFFQGANPLGRRFSYGDRYRAEGSVEIIGVVRDNKYWDLRQNTPFLAYTPTWMHGAERRLLCLRTTADPKKLIAAVRREVQALDRAVPLLDTHTMEEQVDSTLIQEKLIATLSSFFGVLALVLAAVGLYGVMAHAVTRRTREIGIRMALGAQRPAVLWLILRDVALLVLAGVAIGVPAALALTRFVASLLYGISPHDPISTAAASVVLAAVAILAGYLPARRATRVDPTVALRYE